jgi:predicted XRE-type DNA-binding protein
MSKARKRIDDPRQLSILEEMRLRQDSPENRLGSMRCKSELQEAINQALKKCPLSRHQVAGEMSHLLNEEISKAQIDSWTAESKDDRHIPAEYLPAFCEVTGYDAPLMVMTRKRRLYAFQEPEALRSEIHRMREEAKQILKEVQERERLLKMLNTQLGVAEQ